MQVTQWFSSPIFKFHLDIDVDKIIPYIYDLQTKNKGVVKSNRGGWQCNELIDAPAEHHKLVSMVDSALVDVHQYMGLRSDTPSMIDHCWYNINQPTSYNVRHLHNKSIFSGAFYLKVPEGDSGDIIFYRENLFLSYLPDDIVNQWNEMTSGLVTHHPEQCMLLIFPSWLEHSVTPNFTNEDRISFSFNSNTRYYIPEKNTFSVI